MEPPPLHWRQNPMTHYPHRLRVQPPLFEQIPAATIRVRAALVQGVTGHVHPFLLCAALALQEMIVPMALRHPSQQYTITADAVVGGNLVAKEHHARGHDVHVGMQVKGTGHVSHGRGGCKRGVEGVWYIEGAI